MTDGCFIFCRNQTLGSEVALFCLRCIDHYNERKINPILKAFKSSWESTGLSELRCI